MLSTKESMHPLAVSDYEAVPAFLRTLVLGLQCALLWPLFSTLPLWLVAFCAVALSLRLWLNYRKQAAAPRWLNILMMLLVMGGLVFELFAQSFSLAVNLSFFVMLYVLKALELKTHKDILWLLYISTVLIACVFFVNQSLLISVYVLVCFVVLLGVLMLSYRREGMADFFWGDIKHSLKLVVQALPIMVFLLVFMPRIGPLWSVPMMQEGHRTGMGDTLNPGSVSKLLESNELVFRARFLTEAPQESELYWRGLVLTFFDGSVWRVSDAQDSNDDALDLNKTVLDASQLDVMEMLVADGSQADYEVILEPSDSRWVYGLAAPVAVQSLRHEGDQGPALRLDSRIQTSRGLTAFASNQSEQRIEYAMRVLPRSALEVGLTESERAVHVQLPDGSNPQAAAQAVRWFASVGGDAGRYVDLLTRWIGENEFYYTLEPPQLSEDAFVDEFLFKSQQGFCEHYASAVTFLLRSVGIPARVVVGYHGGSLADDGLLVSVRQRNAHAWLEWWSGSGWQRFDPTSAIAPERVMKDAQSVFRNASSNGSGGLSGWGRGVSMLSMIRARWDTVNYQWASWALGFDETKRKRVLSDWLGGLSIKNLTLGVAKAVACILLFMMFSSMAFKPSRSRSSSSWVTRYQRIQRSLPLGGERVEQMTPNEWSRRVQVRYPSLASEVGRYVQRFNSLEYRVRQSNETEIKLERDLIVAYNQCANRLRRRIFWLKLTQFNAFK